MIMARNILFFLVLGVMFFSCGRKTAVAKVEEPQEQEEVTEKEALSQSEIFEAVTEEVEEEVEDKIYLLCELKRTSCYGKCPVYHIKLYSNGTVTYDGKANVEKIGNYVSYCEPESIEAVFTAAAEANYFVLRSQYPEDGRKISDLPKTITYLKRDGLEKRVIDNFDAPANLVDFEKWLEVFFNDLEWSSSN